MSAYQWLTNAGQDHLHLAAELQRREIRVPEEFMQELGLAENIGRANGLSTEESLEWLADRFELLPAALSHNTCTSQAEQLLRRVVSAPRTEEPWLPFSTLGPLLIFAHYNPAATDTWGIPHSLCLRVLVSDESYAGIKKDLEGRLGIQPLANQAGIGHLSPPGPEATLAQTLEWFVQNYPMDQVQAEKLFRVYEEHKESEPSTVADFGFLPRHFPIALNYLRTGEPAFTPEEAPAQEVFPDTLLEKHAVYPMFCGKRKVYLLTADKSDYAFEDEWLSSGHAPVELVKVHADRSAILDAINRSRGRSGKDTEAVNVDDLVYSENDSLVEIEPHDVAHINPASMNASAEDIVQWALYRCVTQNASDLHIEKFYNTARFRARIDGQLKVIHSCSEEALQRFVAIIKNYSNMGHQRQDAQDARFSMRIGPHRVDCRVSAIPVRKEQQKLTLRFLDKEGGLKSLEQLNLSPRQSAIVQQAMSRDQGLVLVTGPTGSGKTTSLYAFLNSINNDKINIHTVEDPIEYEIEGINQTQTDPVHGIDFSQGLRRIMRADPDVILIGESRDEETATAAVNAALTGHLVLTTLHANDCMRAVSRLLSMGVPTFLLADALALTQAQRLVRRLCTYCKRPRPFTPDLEEHFARNGARPHNMNEPVYEAVGCSECGESGYLGRIALMEMCTIDAELSDLVLEGAPRAQMREVARKSNFLTLYQEGLMQVLSGNTTLEEISCLSYTALA